ncbi:M48 family metallopeptidase [Brotaphodocola sp.]|uniref:M48 family metallopeptidase n=1 Tax=Brotaphodocola sp. TaxID=3073577 RepID=UPI003D7D4447
MKKQTEKTWGGYDLIRTSRKTIAIQITLDGDVTVRAPRDCDKAEIDDLIRDRREWIEEKVEEFLAQKKVREKRQEQFPEITPENEPEFRRLAKEKIRSRVAFFAERVGVDYGKITIKDTKSRWGSCSYQGNLNFCWRLILAPEEVLDYIVVHELCHRLEMNHSARFWAEVGRVLPEYEKSKAWLKENGLALLER